MNGRWFPTTEEELQAALADGRLDEGPYLDFKRQPTSGKKGNVELARDIAMFANDGGVLIFGVDEPADGQFVATPVPLDGLRERIEQVATSRLDPPLHVTVHTIRCDTAPEHGYVVVEVPASAAAPHMTDGRYYGRAGTTRAVLSDTQVRAIITARMAAIRDIDTLLDQDIARDPIPDQRSHAHLHVVARPRFSEPDLLIEHVERAGNWSTWLHKQILADAFDPPLGTWAPDLNSGAGEVGRRARGAALHDYYMGQDRGAAAAREDNRHEKQLLDLEIDEDGTLHLFCGRGSDMLPDAGQMVLLPAVVVGLVLRVVQVAARISEQTRYQGSWDFAVALTDLRGVIAYTQCLDVATPAYSANDYRATTAADTPELVTAHRDVAHRLVGRLLRALGQDGQIDTVFPPRS